MVRMRAYAEIQEETERECRCPAKKRWHPQEERATASDQKSWDISTLNIRGVPMATELNPGEPETVSAAPTA